MSTAAAKEQIRELTQKLNKWAEAYYSKDDPVVPDALYDEAIRKLRALEEAHPALRLPNSPTSRVGAVHNLSKPLGRETAM